MGLLGWLWLERVFGFRVLLDCLGCLGRSLGVGV